MPSRSYWNRFTLRQTGLGNRFVACLSEVQSHDLYPIIRFK